MVEGKPNALEVMNGHRVRLNFLRCSVTGAFDAFPSLVSMEYKTDGENCQT